MGAIVPERHSVRAADGAIPQGYRSLFAMTGLFATNCTNTNRSCQFETIRGKARSFNLDA